MHSQWLSGCISSFHWVNPSITVPNEMLIALLQHSVIVLSPATDPSPAPSHVESYCFVFDFFFSFFFFSSAVKSYDSPSGCRPGRWAGGGNPGWGWRLCGPSLFWWPPPGSGSAWSSGRPAPALLIGSLLRCSGPTPSLDTHQNVLLQPYLLFITSLNPYFM